MSRCGIEPVAGAWVVGAAAVAGLLAAAAAGCRPTLDDRPWLVTAPRIVAVKIDPPEAAPGQMVTLDAVAADPTGGLDPGGALWSWCRSGKPLGESRVAADPCLAVDPSAADAAGSPASLTIPVAACQLFGPDTPQPARGAPPTRPRDPDASGGYYQPIAVALGGADAVALARVSCGLADASLAVARAFQAAYHANQNPHIASLQLQIDGAIVDPAATPIPLGARVAVQLTWTAGDAESFPVFDRDSRTLVDTQERLDVAWYVTGGTLDVAAAQITDGNTLSSSTTWTTPPGPVTVQLVAVLRDSRGGSDALVVQLPVE